MFLTILRRYLEPENALIPTIGYCFITIHRTIHFSPLQALIDHGLAVKTEDWLGGCFLYPGTVSKFEYVFRAFSFGYGEYTKSFEKNG